MPDTLFTPCSTCSSYTIRSTEVENLSGCHRISSFLIQRTHSFAFVVRPSDSRKDITASLVTASGSDGRGLVGHGISEKERKRPVVELLSRNLFHRSSY